MILTIDSCHNCFPVKLGSYKRRTLNPSHQVERAYSSTARQTRCLRCSVLQGCWQQASRVTQRFFRRSLVYAEQILAARDTGDNSKYAYRALTWSIPGARKAAPQRALRSSRLAQVCAA